MEIPRIISVDDHVVEPPDLWEARLPARYRKVGPRVRRAQGRAVYDGTRFMFAAGHGPGTRPVDVWTYEDCVAPITRGLAQVGSTTEPSPEAISYDDMRPGCFVVEARLADMDVNHTDASICFPAISRFCGQLFLERDDKDLALMCVQVYNDWMIDEWCAGVAKGRLIPLTMLPLWDPELAAREVRRCADKGSHAVTFCELPAALGLPSIHSGAWDPLIAACEDTETVINMHIGSSSKNPITSPDAPIMVLAALLWQNSMHGFLDWILSGKLVEFQKLKIAFSEGQVGWMPFVLERLDSLWDRRHMYGGPGGLEDNPRSYLDRIYGCIFDDAHGLESREQIGMSQIMFETDYPHADSTWPHSAETAQKLASAAGLDEQETYDLLRGNAIRCYGLQRFGINN